MLTCSITPGRLLRQYFVRWQNGSSGATYRDIPPIGLPTPPTATPPDPRYSIDPVTFSLTITDVQLSDSDSSYRCVLGVVDPRSNRVFTYERTENTDLQLIVFSEFNETPYIYIYRSHPLGVTLAPSLTPKSSAWLL